MWRASGFFLLYLYVFSAQANSTKSIQVPKEVVEKLKTMYSLGPEKPVRIVYIDVAVQLLGDDLEQKRIMGEAQRVLDLGSIITNRHKDFRVYISPAEKIEGRPKLFFISKYQPIKIANDTFGLECGKVLMLHKHLPELESTGIKVSNLGSHYAYVMGGDYLLTYLNGTTLKVGYFQIRDGRMIQQLCRSEA